MLTSEGGTRAWRKLRAACLDRDGWECQIPGPDGAPCGAYATHADHVIPRAHGGPETLDNLRAACAACNMGRSRRDPGGLVRQWGW